jgi:hypothetical protein
VTFPGRWVGGGSLVLAPSLLLLGIVLRLPVFLALPPERLAALQGPTFFPVQLAAVETRPTLMLVSYGSVLAGTILLWPAVVTLAALIGTKHPRWALWGGSLTLLGLFARTFHAGVDHFAFQLVRVQGLQPATEAVRDSYRAISYGPFDLIGILGFAVFFGWPVLAIGAHLSRVLGLVRSLALGFMAALMAGVLKGSTDVSVVATAGLCLALVPLGIQLLRGNDDGSSVPGADVARERELRTATSGQRRAQTT